MDYHNLPVGFGMALAMNEPALNAYSAMSEAEKRVILEKARNAQSETQMHQIVSDILANRMR